jgi:hypothetical protein
MYLSQRLTLNPRRHILEKTKELWMHVLPLLMLTLELWRLTLGAADANTGVTDFNLSGALEAHLL